MGEAKRRRDLGLGATGEYPHGISRRPGDLGALTFAVSDPDADGNIHIDFGCDVSWLALPRDQVLDLCRLLLRKAGAKKVEITL